MQSKPLRTTVIGSYPFPSWLEFATANLDEFGRADLAEMQDDAATCAIADQLAAGLDAVTDGEQTRFDFNLSSFATSSRRWWRRVARRSASMSCYGYKENTADPTEFTGACAQLSQACRVLRNGEGWCSSEL